MLSKQLAPKGVTTFGWRILRKEMSFVDHREYGSHVDRLEIAEKLERNVAFQTRVPSPEHGPEGAASQAQRECAAGPRRLTRLG